MLSGRHLTVCYPFAGDSLGGSHISSLGLLKQLDPQRFRAVIVPEVPDGRIAELFREFEQVQDPGRPRRPFAPGEAFGPAKFARTLGGILPRVRLLRELEVDIVHVNDGRTAAGWALPARLAGKRLVWHHRANPNSLGLRLLAPALAHRVLTVSSFALPQGRIWSAAKKAEVVHSPFDTTLSADRDQARRRVVEELGLPDDALICGFFGSFVPRKRPLLFVDAIVELREELDRPVFGLMFGEAKHPDMERRLEAHIDELGAGDAVRMMEFRKPGHFWIAACDQLVVPAVGEPFGRTLIEAMLVGTPVVAVESGGNVEALENGLGILVPPDEAGQLAAACAELARDPAGAAKMSAKARADARSRFGERRHGERVMEIYAELMPGASPLVAV